MTKTRGKKRGPKGPSKPLSDADYRKVLRMVRIFCTRKEIAAVLDMSESTLDRRVKERGYENFEALYEKYSAEGKSSLRRLQYKSAQAGNATMQIWLGKQVLGQKDKQEIEGSFSVKPSEALLAAFLGEEGDAAVE